MISLTNYDFQWARSELVIIYPDFIRFLEPRCWFPQRIFSGSLGKICNRAKAMSSGVAKAKRLGTTGGFTKWKCELIQWMGTAWRLCQGRNPAQVVLCEATQFLPWGVRGDFLQPEQKQWEISRTRLWDLLIKDFVHVRTLSDPHLLWLICLMNVAYAGWIPCVLWGKLPCLFLSEMLWFFLGQSPMLGSFVHRHLPPKRELQAIGSHSWESPSQDSPVWCTSTDGHRWHGLVANWLAVANWVTQVYTIPQKIEVKFMIWRLFNKMQNTYPPSKKKNTLLRVIPTMTFIHFVTGKSSGILSDIFSGIRSGILSGISSGIYSDISSGIRSGILSGISSGIYSDISSGILSGILSGISSGISIWHIFWHMFWHSIWHSIWHIFWHIIWQIFWHSIWHSI